MDIISRSDAIRQKRQRYFTGVPCKYGHLVERYTKNAACLECLHPKFDSVEREETQRYRDNKRRMIRRKFRVWPESREAFRNSLYALALNHEPQIEPEDIEVSGARPMVCTNGLHIYAFWIFPEDEPLARILEVPWDDGRVNGITESRVFPPAATPEPQEWPDHDPA